jgi:hypothetical protein
MVNEIFVSPKLEDPVTVKTLKTLLIAWVLKVLPEALMQQKN